MFHRLSWAQKSIWLIVQNGSKANNAEGNTISEVESSIARESSSMGLALNFQASRG